MGLFDFVCTWFRGIQKEPNRKRRGDELYAPHGSKLRCVDGPNSHGESSMRLGREPDRWISQREENFQALLKTQHKVGQTHMSSWGQNGKENCVQYYSPAYNSGKNSVMDRHHNSQRDSTDDVQVLEVHNQRTSKPKRAKDSLKIPGSSHSGTVNRRSTDVEIVEFTASPRTSSARKDVEIIKSLYTPQGSRRDDSDIQIVRECGSASKNARCNKDQSVAGRPFKVLNPSASALASSTPILLPNGRPFTNSSEEPEIQVLPSSSITNGLASCRYRSQSSILSSDSNNSRSQSTLNHMKRVEDYRTYNQMFLSACGAERPFLQRLFSPQNGPRSSDSDEVQAIGPSTSQSVQRHLRSHIDSQVPMRFNTPVGSTSSERINIPVDRKNEHEPSTSASRRMSDDADLQYLGQVQTPVPIQPSYGQDVLVEILAKYAEKDKIREEIEEKSKIAKLLTERNQLAKVDRSKKIEADLTEQIKAYLRVTEEVEEDKKDAEIPPLPELTEDMQMEIDRALSARPDQVLVNAFNLTIKGRDMVTLKPLAWLNDEVINFYMNLLIERGKSDNYPKIYAFNTFFFPKLVGTGYDSLKRWTRKVDVFAHDYILVPVHRGMHWCMAIINMKEKIIRYYDSMNGPFPQCTDALLMYLQKESMDKKKQQFDTTGWIKEHAEDIPQQNNGSDCGMFACMYAEYVSREARITFTQADMPYFRRKVVYEILKVKLLC